MKGLLVLLFGAAVLFMPFAAIAQTGTTTPEEDVEVSVEEPVMEAPRLEPPPPLPKPDGLELCTDYYQPGNVTAPLSSELSGTLAGGTIGFTSVLTNAGSYPLTDATVYVRISRVDGPVRGQVDWFPVMHGPSLATGGSIGFSFDWTVPRDAAAGTYEAATYVVSSDRFDLAGSIIPTSAPSGTSRFSVQGEEIGTVSLEGITINDEPYQGDAVLIPAGAPTVPVMVTIRNTTGVPVRGNVHFRLYEWNPIRGESALLAESDEGIEVSADDARIVRYLASDAVHGAYYVSAEFVTAEGSKSIIGARFMRSDVRIPRLVFVGASNYPAQEGNTVAVACIKSTSLPVENGRIDLIASRAGGLWSALGFLGLGRLAEARYEGVIPSETYALVAPFSGNAEEFSVTARLYENDRLVDSLTLPYACEAFIGCGTLEPPTPPFYVRYPYAPWIAVGLGIVGMVGAFLFIRRMREKQPPPL